MSVADAELPLEDEWAGWERSGLGRRWKRLRRNLPLVIGLGLVGLFVVAAVGALVKFGNDLTNLPFNIAIAQSSDPPGPSWGHLFGTMRGTGLDVLNSLVRATPIDLALVGGPIVVAFLAGVMIGGYAAVRGGLVDGAITVGADLFVGVPPFFFVLVLFLGVQRLFTAVWSLPLFGILFALILFPYYARPTRARALQVTKEGYVEAARASGATTRRIVLRHVLPNSLSPALAQVPIDVYNIFFVLTVFPYLSCPGAGNGLFSNITPLPRNLYPEWGNLLASGTCYGLLPSPAPNLWWMWLFPLATIVFFGLAVALLCDGAERYFSVARSM